MRLVKIAARPGVHIIRREAIGVPCMRAERKVATTVKSVKTTRKKVTFRFEV
jgi:hypothetical protein